MDGVGSPPPDVYRGNSQADQAENASQSGANATSSTSLPSTPSHSSAPSPFSHPGTSVSLTPREQASLLTPKGMFDAVANQLLGEKSQEQKQREQEQQAKIRERVARAQQEYQAYKAQESQRKQQIIEETLQLKDEGRKQGAYDGSSAMLSQTTGADRSEQAILGLAIKNAQEAKIREQKARQAMMSQSTPKGPQAEGGKAKTNMMATMQSDGDENPHDLKNNKDARQRQREQAAGE